MISTEELEGLMAHCLFTEEEVAQGEDDSAVKAEGIIGNFGFHPGRLDEVKEKVKGMLQQLSDTFKEGWSFLNMCMTKDGQQWGEHRNMEQLVVLGMACGYVKYCFPRSMWDVLPGGMPYIIIALD